MTPQHALDDVVDADRGEGRSYDVLLLLAGEVDHENRPGIETAVARNLIFLCPRRS